MSPTEYSKIVVNDVDELAAYFIRACYAHGKRGIQDLRPYVTDQQYEQLMGFFYLPTKQEVEEFGQWIGSLSIPRVQVWWDHKVVIRLVNQWILPALIKCLSKMYPADWDRTPSTTNVGEAQHHWTNINTGVKMSLLEAIIAARECDERTAEEIKSSLSSGIPKNNRNNEFTRMKRGANRANNATKKIRETREKDEALASINEALDSEMKIHWHKENKEKIKALKAQKSELASKHGKLSTSKAE
jgi:hypothetical protein